MSGCVVCDIFFIWSAKKISIEAGYFALRLRLGGA
jgi:hypothetical protein